MHGIGLSNFICHHLQHRAFVHKLIPAHSPHWCRHRKVNKPLWLTAQCMKKTSSYVGFPHSCFQNYISGSNFTNKNRKIHTQTSSGFTDCIVWRIRLWWVDCKQKFQAAYSSSCPFTPSQLQLQPWLASSNGQTWKSMSSALSRVQYRLWLCSCTVAINTCHYISIPSVPRHHIATVPATTSGGQNSI